MTAAKLEAQIIDQTTAKDREDNKRRKWDCFHIATAMELRCRMFYARDNKMLARKAQFGITGMDFSKPVPRSLPLLDDSIAPIEVHAEKTNGKDTTTNATITESKTDAARAISAEAGASNQLQAAPAHSPPIQRSDSGRAECETTGEEASKKTEKENLD